MKRFIIDKLIEWKGRNDRKPLIIRGAKQVGKIINIPLYLIEYIDNFI